MYSQHFAKARESARPMWIILVVLASGFWLFSFFRFIGLVEWPLSRAVDLAGYARLLYFHFVIATSVLTPVVIAGKITTTLPKLSWGSWTGNSFSIPLRTVLRLALIGIWIWAFIVIHSVKPYASGPVMGLAVISLLKAALSGATEEICFRGLIQSAAIERFGIPMGIVLQSCLYTAFHIHLVEVFFSHTGFLAGTMALGLVFGAVTRLSSGIGWAVGIHTAINLVIEWRNLS